MQLECANFEEMKTEIEKLQLLNEKLETNLQEKEMKLGQIQSQFVKQKKEIACIQNISNLFKSSELAIDEILQKATNLIPNGFQFPDLASVKIELNQKIYKSDGFVDSPIELKLPIKIGNQIKGTFCINYKTSPDLENMEEVFLSEEITLFNNIVQYISIYCEKIIQSNQLKISEFDYYDLITRINEVIIKINLNHQIIFVSPNIERIFGYRPDEVLGKTIFEFATIKQQEFLLEAKKSIITSNSKFLVFEVTLLTKTRELRMVSVSVNMDFEMGELHSFTGTITDVTNRKQIEDELVKKDLLYQSVVDASPDAITITDMNGTVEYCSLAGLKIFNIPNYEAVIGRNILEFVNEEGRKKAIQGIENMFKGVMFGADEYLGIKYDNSFIHIEVNGEFVKDLLGNPQKMVFVIRDITNRKHTEIKLVETENKFQQLVENINDVIYELSVDGTLDYISPSILQVAGYKPEEVVGKNFLSFIYEEDIELAVETMNSIASKTISTIELRIIHKNQSFIWVRTSTSPIILQGEFNGSRGSLFDINDRKIFDLKIKESEEKLSQLYQNIAQGIVYQNAKGEITHANPAAEKLLGLTMEQMQGKTSSDPDWKPINSKGEPFPGDRHPSMVSLQTGKKIKNVEMGIYHPISKKYVWILMSSIPQFLPNEKKPYQVFTSYTDITAQKEAENDLNFRTKLQKMLMKISSIYINLPFQDLENAITNSLHDLGEFMNADRFYLFEYDFDKMITTNTHEWCADGIEPQIENFKDTPIHEFEFFVNSHKNGETIYIYDVLALDPQERLREILEPQGIQSVIAVPLMDDNICVGFVGFDAVKQKHQYSDTEDELLRIFTLMLINAKKRIKSENLIHQSEEKLRIIADNNYHWEFWIDVHGNPIYHSPSCLKVSGFEADELINNHELFFQLIHPEDREAFSNHKLVAQDNQKGVAIQFRIINKDNELRYIEHVCQPVFGKNQEYLGIRGTNLDITEKMITHEELRQREEQLSKLFDSQTNYILRTDLEGNATYWNKKFETDYGYCYQGVSNTDFNSLKSIKEYHHKKTIETVEKCIANPGSIFQVELDKTNKLGEIRTSLWEFVSLLDKNGQPEGLQCMGIDITERNEAIKAMQTNEEKYRTLFVNSPIAYFIIQNGVFVELNEAASQLYDSSKEYLIGKSPVEISPEYQPNGRRSDELVAESFDKVFTEGNISFDWIHTRENGTNFIAEINLSPIEFQQQTAIFVAWQDITQRRHAEENNRKLSQAVEQSPVSIVITNLDGNIEYANKQAINSTGYTIEELIGTNPRILKSGETDSSEYNELWENITKGSEWRGQFHNRRKNGDLYWEQSNISPIKNSNGEITHFLAVKEDITKRKETELALKMSELRFSQVLEQGSTVVWELDQNGIFSYISPNCFTIWGYKPEELIGIHNIVFIFDASINEEIIQNSYDQLINDGFIKDNETPICHKNGSLIWVNFNAFALKNEKGEFIGFRGSGKDITRQKLAQDEIKKFRTISEQANYGSAIANLKGTLLYVNDAFARMHDYSIDNLIGKNLMILHNAEQQEFVRSLGEKIQTEGGFNAHEVWHIKKDGTAFPTLMNAKIIRDNQGNPEFMAASIIDITNLKIAEQALLKSEEQLNFAQEIAKMGSWEINLITNEVNWSKNYFGLLEIDPSEKPLSMEELTKLIHPDDRKIFDDIIYKLNQNWSIETIEFRFLMKDGFVKWIQSNMIPIFDEDTLIGINGVSIDITEKKKAEEKIIDQNKRLTAILDAIPDMMFVLNSEGEYLEFFNANSSLNPAFTKDFKGKNIFDIIDKPTSFFHLEKIKNCLSTGEIITYEYQHKFDDKPNHFEARNVKMDQNKVLRFVRNITEKKRNEFELQKLRLAIEQSPVTMVITDLKGNITYASPSFENTTGYSINEVIGRNINILKSGKTDSSVYRKLWSDITEGLSWEGEWINKKKNGEFYWEHISITPVKNENQQAINYLAIKQDISERKKQEELILELNSTLEKKVESRTQELGNANIILKKEIEERIAIALVLKEKSQELENFFTVSLDLLCITDMDGNFIRANKSWEKILGYSLEELLSMNFLSLIHEDDIGETLEAMNILSSQNPIINFINRYRTKEGTYKYIEWHSAPSGNFIYAAARDITERKRAEEFELEMLELAPKLTRVSYTEVQNAINLALARIGQVLDSDRVYIFEFNKNQTEMDNTYEWCNVGVQSEIENLKNLPVEIFPKWVETLHNHQIIQIYSVKDLSDEWIAEREILEPQGVQSLVVLPMNVEERLIGFVGLDSVKSKRSYSKTEINILRILSSILSSLIHNLETETLLEQTRQNYETFFNTIDDFLWVLDSEAKIIHTNQTVLDRLHYKEEDLIDQNVLSVHPIERREEAGRIVGEMLDGISEYCPVPLVSKDGMQIPVETRVKRGKWNGQDVIFGVSKDISQIKLSEQKFSSAFQSNSAGMCISLMSNEKYMDVNNSMLELLNYSKEEFVGKTATDLDVFVSSVSKTLMDESLINEIPISKYEVQLRSKLGDIKTVLLSADLIYIGSERCLLTVIVDITDRKHAEEALEIARKDADLANQAKSEFLSRMSHELRTPMNSILGFAQLLKMSQLDLKQQKGVNHILNGGKHLLELINEVLDIAKIEAGRISLSIESFDINDIIQEMIDTVSLNALLKQINIQTDFYQSTSSFVSADKQRLKQVLLNFINNGIKYNNEKGLIIIKTERINYLNGSMIRTSIIDNGIGIAKENLEKLFHPFERIGAENYESEGTGLGLAVVKKLVEIMQGNVGVDSQPDVGSTFWFELPFSDNKALHGLKIHDELPTDIQKSKKQSTIFYIEDNASNIELMEQILGQMRPEIHLISTNYGRDALKLAKEIKPNLIFLDLNLPDIHGSELLKILSANNAISHIPIVIISADAMQNQLEKLIKLGAAAYLTKPIEIELLLSTINKHLK
jgi:PAS domain S-box-containing protein